MSKCNPNCTNFFYLNYTAAGLLLNEVTSKIKKDERGEIQKSINIFKPNNFKSLKNR